MCTCSLYSCAGQSTHKLSTLLQDGCGQCSPCCSPQSRLRRRLCDAATLPPPTRSGSARHAAAMLLSPAHQQAAEHHRQHDRGLACTQAATAQQQGFSHTQTVLQRACGTVSASCASNCVWERRLARQRAVSRAVVEAWLAAQQPPVAGCRGIARQASLPLTSPARPCGELTQRERVKPEHRPLGTCCILDLRGMQQRCVSPGALGNSPQRTAAASRAYLLRTTHAAAAAAAAGPRPNVQGLRQ
jgi:hypothetical protein